MINVSYDAVDNLYRKQWFKDDYYAVKELLKKHSVNDSFPELLDHTTDNSIVALIDNLVVEVEFDDMDLNIRFHQIFKLINQESLYGGIPILLTVDEDDYEEAVKDIDRMALMNYSVEY